MKTNPPMKRSSGILVFLSSLLPGHKPIFRRDELREPPFVPVRASRSSALRAGSFMGSLQSQKMVAHWDHELLDTKLCRRCDKVLYAVNHRFMERWTRRPHPVTTQAKMRARAVPTPAARSTERGSAVLIILIVVSLMLSFMFANSKSLRHLKEEMRLIEQRQLQQLKKHTGSPAAKPAGATNSVSGQPGKTVPLLRQP